MPVFVTKPKPKLKAAAPASSVPLRVLNFLKSAVEYRISLRLNYPPGMRQVEPHALGLTKEGHVVLRAWQVDGASESGEHSNWKLFRVDRIDTTLAYGPTFKVRLKEGYKRGDRAMAGGIIAQV